MFKNFKQNLLAVSYAIFSCVPPAPVLLLNIIAFFSPAAYRNKTPLKAAVMLFLITLVFVPFQIDTVSDFDSYLLSYAGILFVFFTSVSAAYYVAESKEVEILIKTSAVCVGLAFSVASVVFFVSGNPDMLGGWYEHHYTYGVTTLRYGGFMYEASHFGLIVAPLIFYFFSDVGFFRKNLIYVAILLVTLLATLSIGFFVTFFITLVIVSVASSKGPFGLLKSLSLVFVLLVSALLLYSFNEVFSLRVDNILAGDDSSTAGRTFDAFNLAYIIAEKNSVFFGVGPGQIKFLGHDLIIDHYRYDPFLHTVVRIPSSLAELLAYYGFAGVFLKLVALVFLYFKFRVFDNRYANSVFVFFFIYQFYGGFMVSAIEIFCFAYSFAIAMNRVVPAVYKPYIRR